MHAQIISSPPLGMPTVVPIEAESITFTVLLETLAADPSKTKEEEERNGWEVHLWHNHHDRDRWEELPLRALSAEQQKSDIFYTYTPTTHHNFFTGSLPRPQGSHHPTSFTIKFRPAHTTTWLWSSSHSTSTNTNDGTLLFPTPATFTYPPITTYLPSLSPSITSTPYHPADIPGTSVYVLHGPIPGAGKQGTQPGHARHPLGPVAAAGRWTALVRLWAPWLAPRHGGCRGYFDPDKEAVLVGFERGGAEGEGRSVVLLALSEAGGVVGVLTGDGQGGVLVEGWNDGVEEREVTVLVAVAGSYEVAVEAAVYAARRVVGGGMVGGLGGVGGEDVEGGGTVKGEWYEEWTDGLTYCTWNGLGQRLTEERILEALASLEREGVRVANLIVDDNWQSLDNEGAGQFQRGWVEFEANRQGFPHGLKHAVTTIRERFGNVRHVAVWHALLGYWGGIAPDGKIAKEYGTVAVRKKDGVAGGTFHVVDGAQAARLYDDFYRFLADAGVDAVKTDAQFFLDELAEAPDRQRLVAAYQDGWLVAGLRHLAGRMISCMSLAPPLIFRSQLPPGRPRFVLRNSDDFFPAVPASHAWHVFCNAAVACFTARLNVLPDWDMFQTRHAWAAFHAAARCLSGGPVAITDVPGHHDPALLRAMTARSPRSARSAVLLRPSLPATTTEPYTAFDQPRLLKLSTFANLSSSPQIPGTPLLGLFNTTPHPCTELLPLDDPAAFPGLQHGGTAAQAYVLRAYTNGRVSAPFVPGRRDHQHHALIHLHPHPLLHAPSPDKPAWEILTAHPVFEHTIPCSADDGGNRTKTFSLAPLGLIDKLTGAAGTLGARSALVLPTPPATAPTVHLHVTLKALGRWGVWVGDLDRRRDVRASVLVAVAGRAVGWEWVRVDGRERVVEVDVEGWWGAEMDGGDGGWGSNEVEVEVVFRV